MFIAKAASVLQSRVLGDRNQWTSAAMTWSRLQGELADRRTTVNTPNTVLGVTRKREEGRGSERETVQRETVQRGEESSRETCGVEAQTLEKKRKRDDEEKESEKQRTPERERKRQYEEDAEEEERRMALEFSSCRQNGRKGISETDLCGRGSICVDATSGLDLKVERSCRNMEDMAEAEKNVEHGNKIIFSVLICYLHF